MAVTEFDQETERKEALLTLLETHEREVKFKDYEKVLAYGFYDRIFHGVAIVEKVGKSSLCLKRENGRPLGLLLVTPTIASLSKKDDHLLAELGHRDGHWYLKQIRMIGSEVKNGNGESNMHLSMSRQNFMTDMSSLNKMKH